MAGMAEGGVGGPLNNPMELRAPALLIPRAPQRRAVHAAVNDYGRPDANLRGCLNDQVALREYLGECGYEDVILLQDRDATPGNTRQACREQAAKSKPGDVLGLCYSGHGSFLPDTDGDEPVDHVDECLVMADALRGGDFRAGCITDDDLASWAAFVPRGVLLFGWLDSCHSGSMARAFTPASVPMDAPRFLPPPDDELKRARGSTRGGRIFRRRISGQIITEAMPETLLSGCAPDQTSADSYIDGAWRGAFTHYMLKSLRSMPGASIASAHEQCVREIKRAGYSQTPQLEGRSANLRLPLFLRRQP